MSGRRSRTPGFMGNLESLGDSAARAGRAIASVPSRAVRAGGDIGRALEGDSGASYRSTAAARRGAASAQQTRSGLRDKAVGAANQKTTNALRQVRTEEENARMNQEAIQSAAARSFASNLNTNMSGGGGAIAASGQVSMEADQAGIQQRTMDSQRIADARNNAAQMSLEAAEYEAQQGNEEEEYQAALGQGVTEAEQAIQAGQGFWDDDEAGMMRTIRASVARLRATNPRAAAELEAKYLDPSGEGYKRIHSWWD